MIAMQTTELTTLSTDEIDDLVEFEAIIDQSQALFIEVGNSLMAIRDAKLYRAAHPTFEAYLADRWPAISKRRGYQLIDAAAIAKSVPIQNERQARALKNVPVEQAKQVYAQAAEAVGGVPPTAKAIQAVADGLRLPPDFAAYEAKALACNLRLTRDGEYHITGAADGPRVSSQWSVIKSYLDATERTYQLQAQALAATQFATVAPLPEPEPIASQELIAARRYQTKLCSGFYNLAQSKDRQQVRTLCTELLDCLNTLDGLPTAFDKAIEAVLTMAADLLDDLEYQELAARMESVVMQ